MPRIRKPGTPEQNRKANLWRLYKMRPAEYDALRALQGYKCAICERHEDDVPVHRGGRPRTDGAGAPVALLAVDHDHMSGAVRGLLCYPCNVGVGMFAESPERLRGALRYLGSSA